MATRAKRSKVKARGVKFVFPQDLEERYVEALELRALCEVLTLGGLGLDASQFKTLQDEIKERTRHMTVFGKADYREYSVGHQWNFSTVK